MLQELHITTINPQDLLQNREDSLAMARFIRAGYRGQHIEQVLPITDEELHEAKLLEGLEQAQQINILHVEGGSIGAVLATSIYTRENNPEFFQRMNEKLDTVDMTIRPNVEQLFDSVSAWVYTHEMVTSITRRGKRDIARLRQEALKNIGVDLESTPIVFMGEYQGIHSMGVQVNLPNSVSILAKEYIPGKNSSDKLDETTLAAMQVATGIIGSIYFERNYPESELYDDGTIASDVFIRRPPNPDVLAHPSIFEAQAKISRRQRTIDAHGSFPGKVASAIGATFVNVI